MGHGLRALAAAAMVVAVGIAAEARTPPAAVTAGGASIAVRTYTPQGSEADLRTARVVARDILRRAGIHVRWFECGLAGADASDSDRCGRPRAGNELVVRLVDADSAEVRPAGDSLGFAFIDLESGSGWLATVYVDRVDKMVQEAGTNRAELLGLAMAHEIGHLLLGTNAHARAGLMRASWSGADLRRNRAIQWTFDRSEAELMRQAIASRLGS